MAKKAKKNLPSGWQRTFIKEWREKAKVDQEDLAADMGISVPYLSQLENGKRRYNQDMLEKAATSLGCEPADLLRKPGEGDDFRSVLGGLSAEQRAQIAEIAKTFKR